MEKPQYFVGIDVSKKYLDVYLLPSNNSFQLLNQEDGLKKLVDFLKLANPELIVLEATGGLETLAVNTLAKEQLPVVSVNPRQVRDFAKATGQLAKTDLISARMIALFAQAIRPALRPIKSDELQHLESLYTRRKQIIEMIVQEKTD